MNENSKAILSSNLSDSIDSLVITKLGSEIVEKAVPFCEDIAERISSSGNNESYSENQITESCDVYENIDNIVIEEKVCEHKNIHETDDLTSSFYTEAKKKFETSEQKTTKTNNDSIAFLNDLSVPNKNNSGKDESKENAPSANNEHCGGNEETESTYVYKKIQNKVIEEKICENKNVSPQPEMDDLTSSFHTKEEKKFEIAEQKTIETNNDKDDITFINDLSVPNKNNSGKDEVKENADSSNSKYCSENEETESTYVCKKIQNIVVVEKICENKIVSPQPETGNLTSSFYTEGKTKYVTSEQKTLTTNEHTIVSVNDLSVYKINNSSIFRSIEDETKENAALDIKVLEDECPSLHNHFVISKDNVVENGSEIIKDEEYYKDSHNTLFSDDIKKVHVSKHKIIEEKYTEFERFIPPEVGMKRDLLRSIEFEHSEESIPVCKNKILESTLEVLNPEYNKSLPSNIDCYEARIYVQDKKNYETTEKIICNDSDFLNSSKTGINKEITDEAISLYENIAEITSSSANNEHCGEIEETESSYTCEKIQDIVVIEEKICENENVSPQPEAGNLSSTKILENTLDVFLSEYNTSFTSYNGSEEGKNYLQDKNNYRAIKRIISNENHKKDLHFTEKKYSSVSILELENEINETNDQIQMEKDLDECKDLDLDLYHYNTHIRTGSVKKPNENEVLRNEDSQSSSSFISSEINKDEIVIAEPKETDREIPYNDDVWVIIPSPAESTNFKEAENMLQGSRLEIIKTTHGCEELNDQILYNKSFKNLTAVCSLKDKNEFEGRDFYNLHQTISSNTPSLINNTIFNVSSHSVSKDEIDGTNRKKYKKTTEDGLSKVSEERENTESANITGCELIKTERSDYAHPPSSSSAYSVAEECKLQEIEKKRKYLMFSNDDTESSVFFKDNGNDEANRDQNIKNESETIKTVNSAYKKFYERIFHISGFTSFDNSASENLPAFEESKFTKNCSVAEAENIIGKKQHNDLQNKKNICTYLTENEFGNFDEINYSKKEKNVNQKIGASKDYTNTNCKTLVTSSNRYKNTTENSNIAMQTNTCESLASKSCEIRDPDIRTLEDALHYFNLSSLMAQLETSLEDVKRHRKKVEAHEMLLKEVDKQIQKLSFQFHPDRVRNRDGSEKEIEIAQKLQAAINAVRVALNTLNYTFLENIDTDHRYGFYTKLNLSSLGNENEVKNHVYEVFFQIGLLSDIKQQKILAEIRKFLAESQCCIQSYLYSNKSDFQKHRDLALFHLKCCIKGYKKLQSELKIIENECKVEKLENISSYIDRMGTENHAIMTYLRDLKRVAKSSIKGSFQIFTTSETLDEYFVLPFVYYVNIILMCNVLIQNEDAGSVIGVLKFPLNDSQVLKINGISFAHPYVLALSFVDKNQRGWLFKENMSKEELKKEFDKYLKCFNDYLKDTFKECNYADSSMTHYLSEDLKKCMKMMFDFQMKEKELSKNLEKFKRKTVEIDEKYETVMKQNEEFNRIIKERLEKNKKLAEQTSIALSENF